MKKYASFGLLALLLAVSLALASCADAGPGIGQRESGEESADGMQGVDHGSEGMSMETVAPETAGVSVEWASDPAALLPDQPATLSYRVWDARSDQALTDLPINHERPMHLIAVSKDLTQFQHIHPDPVPDGSYSVQTEFPDPGTYVLYDEFVRDGQSVLDRREVPVGEASDAEPSLVLDLTQKTVNGVSVALYAPERIKAGEEASFTFLLTEDGRSVNDLEPYLGAAAHIAVVSANTNDFAHVHGEAAEDSGEEHEGMEAMDEPPPAAFGPEVGFHRTFPRTGLYKVWAQFSRGGDVITVPYVVEVQ